jgi:hypothetical protein
LRLAHDLSRERIYCANSYLTHLDRVDTDPNYAFVPSEINNIIDVLDRRSISQVAKH